jgi:hypothetical protein
MSICDIHTQTIGKLIRSNKKLTTFAVVATVLWIRQSYIQGAKISELEAKVNKLEEKANNEVEVEVEEG